MRYLLISLVVLCLSLSGCASLILRPENSVITKTGKVATRVVLAPVTLGMSEWYIADEKGKEQCVQAGGYWITSRCLSEQGRQEALSMMPFMMQSYNQMLDRAFPTNMQPARSTYQPVSVPNLDTRRSLNCTSYQMGPYTNTTCQ